MKDANWLRSTFILCNGYKEVSIISEQMHAMLQFCLQIMHLDHITTEDHIDKMNKSCVGWQIREKSCKSRELPSITTPSPFPV